MGLLAAMSNLGLVIDNINLDGEIQRTPILNKPANKKNGWYVGRQLNGKTYCTFGRWDTDETVKYISGGEIKAEDRETFVLLTRLAAQEKQRKQHKAQKIATTIIGKSTLVTDHRYMLDKRIKGEALCCDDYLVIPIFDNTEKIVNVQKIYKNGDKKFLYGGKIKECFGKIKGDDTICICEGWATGCTIFMATGYTVIVAFNARNLLNVTRIIFKKYHNNKIIICADNDHSRPGGNIGVEKAKEAAALIDVPLRIPEGAGTDYNDMAAEQGIESVRLSIAKIDNVYTVEDIVNIGVNDITLNLPESIIDPGGLISFGLESLLSADTSGIVQYSFPLVLSLIANAIAGKLRVGEVWPNLYNIKVGGTSTGKTEIDKIVKTAFRHAGIKDFYGPTDFSSGPGLLRGLEANPQCLINLDEITYMFKRFDRPDPISAGKISTLLELHTNAGNEISKPYGNNKNSIFIEMPCVNIIGNATPVIFDDIRPEDFETGLIQRFDFWCYGGKIPQRRYISDGSDKIEKFVHKIEKLIITSEKKCINTMGVQYPFNVEVEDTATKLLKKYSQDIISFANKVNDCGKVGIISRKYNAAIKYAMIHMVSRGSFDILNIKDIEYGILLADLLADWKINILANKVTSGSFHKDCEIFKNAIVSALKAGKQRPTFGILAGRKKILKNWKISYSEQIIDVLAKRGEIILDNSGRKTAYLLAK